MVLTKQTLRQGCGCWQFLGELLPGSSKEGTGLWREGWSQESGGWSCCGRLELSPRGPWETTWSTSQCCPTGVFVTNCWASVTEGHSGMLIPGAATENALGQRIRNPCAVAQSCPTLCDPMDCSPADSSVHGDSPGKNTRVGCHALFQGIFPTQGLELGSPALQADSLPAELPGKPRKPLAIWQTSCRRPCGPYTRTPCSARVSWERNSLTSC